MINAQGGEENTRHDSRSLNSHSNWFRTKQGSNKNHPQIPSKTQKLKQCPTGGERRFPPLVPHMPPPPPPQRCCCSKNTLALNGAAPAGVATLMRTDHAITANNTVLTGSISSCSYDGVYTTKVGSRNWKRGPQQRSAAERTTCAGD